MTLTCLVRHLVHAALFPSGGTAGQLGDSLRNELPPSSICAREVDAMDLVRVCRRLIIVAHTNVVTWVPELL